MYRRLVHLTLILETVCLLFSVSRAQTQTDLRVYAHCYDICGNALEAGELVGRNPTLCGDQSPFMIAYRNCSICLGGRVTVQELAEPDIIQFIDYCNNLVTQTLSGASATATDQSTVSSIRPTTPPCIARICNDTLDEWKIYVKYPDFFGSEPGCRNISQRDEIHVLEECSKAPGCLSVPKNVTDLLSTCKKILAVANSTRDDLSAVAQPPPHGNHLARSKVIGIAVGVTVVALGGILLGVFLLSRKLSVKEMPDPPSVFPELQGESKPRAELDGFKPPTELIEFGPPVEIGTGRPEEDFPNCVGIHELDAGQLETRPGIDTAKSLASNRDGNV